MARRIRLFLSFVVLVTFCSLAWATEMPASRKLPSDTFKRFMVSGTDFKDALSACKFAREGTGWKAIGFDPPNTGGGVNCKYTKGSDKGEQVAATLVFRCPDNSAPWNADGVTDVNKQICACFDGYVTSGLTCVTVTRPADKICADDVYDKLKDKYEQSCKQSGGMSCSEKKLGRKQYGALTCDEAKANLGKQKTCLASRQDFEQKCFASVDAAHQKVLDDHQQGVTTCETAVKDKCSPGSK